MNMKLLSGWVAITLSATAIAQTPPPTSPAAQKSLSATVGVYVFPTNGQPASQQSKDEGECYQWAVTNSGADPFDIQKQEAQQAQQAQAAQQQTAQQAKGAGAKGAVGGAAVGAVIGEASSDDAGAGARNEGHEQGEAAQHDRAPGREKGPGNVAIARRGCRSSPLRSARPGRTSTISPCARPA